MSNSKVKAAGRLTSVSSVKPEQEQSDDLANLIELRGLLINLIDDVKTQQAVPQLKRTLAGVFVGSLDQEIRN